MNKRLLLNGAAAIGARETDRRHSSKLHEAASLFEKEHVQSFAVIVVYPDGRVDCSYDVGANTQADAQQQYGKIMAGCSSLESTLAGKVVEMGVIVDGIG